MKISRIVRKVASIFCAACLVAGCLPMAAVAAGETFPVSASGGYSMADNDGKLRLYVDSTEYNFVQTKDNQEFTFINNVETRKFASKAVIFKSLVFDPYYSDPCTEGNCVFSASDTNLTSDFLLRITSETVTIESGVTPSTWVSDDSSTGTGFVTNGQLNEVTLGKAVMGDFLTYKANATIKFTGNSAERYGEVSTGFYYRANWTCENVLYHAHVPVKINVTDARLLIAKYDEINNIVNRPAEAAKYDADAIDAMEAILESIPDDMLNGSAYYSQADVDAATLTLTDAEAVLETNAYCDYTDLDSAIAMAEKITNVNYTNSSWSVLQNAITAAKNVDRHLLVGDGSNEAVILAAINAITSARQGLSEKLDWTNFNADCATVETFIAGGNDAGIYNDDDFAEFVNSYNSYVTTVRNHYADLPDTMENRTLLTSCGDVIILRLEKFKNDFKKCNYTELDSAITSAKAIKNEYYTDATWEALQSAITAAENIDRTLVVGDAANQAAINAAMESINSAVTNLEDRQLDWTGFDAACTSVETFIADNEDGDLYNESDLTNFINEYNAFVAWAEKSMENTEYTPRNQQKVDEYAGDIVRNFQNFETEFKKCDYTALDEALALADDIPATNNGTYTDSSFAALQTALENAGAVDRTMLSGADESTQTSIDDLTAELEAAISGLTRKANYDEYNAAISAANALTNTNGRYDNDDFVAYKEAVAALDGALEKDLADTEENQNAINAAKGALVTAKENLDADANYFISIYDENGGLIRTEITKSTTVSELNLPELPADTETRTYLGWEDGGTIVNPGDTISSDTQLKVAYEDNKLLPADGSGIIINNETGFITGINGGTNTVDEIIELFENDELAIEIKDRNDGVLGGEDKVGTGSTITLKSRYSETVYETKTLIIKGDVNGDGCVNDTDFNITLSVSIGASEFSVGEDYFFAAADICCDGYIDAVDTMYVELISTGNA